MSSLKNVIPRRAHKERSQPASRKKFGFLEKHKDYVVRAREFHKKQDALQKLKEKAAFRNPDEFNFKMIKAKTVSGVHIPENEANKYNPEQLSLMKTQDVGYVLQKLQSEKKKVEKLQSSLHFLDSQRPPERKHIYFAEDREELKELEKYLADKEEHGASSTVPSTQNSASSSYKELEARKKRVEELKGIYADMCLQKELKKKGKKRKLREDELTVPTDKPVYMWRKERKR